MRFPGGSLSGSDMHRRRAVTVRTAGGFWKVTPVVKETGVLYHPRVRNSWLRARLPHNARHQAIPVLSTSSDSVPKLGGGHREIGPFCRAI